MFLSPADQSANNDVFRTHELNTRVPKKLDHLQEKRALQELAACLADDSGEILPRLVAIALQMSGAATGGLSLHESEPAPGVFRWRHLHGALAPFEGEITPRNYSPCGITLDQRTPVLVRNPERIYDWLVEADISLPEVLLVPLYIGGEAPLGTLWVASERLDHFDSGHARALTEIATFVGLALRMVHTEQSLRKALEGQEMLTREMDHRVKNLFGVMQSLIHTSTKSAASKAELADALSGRVHALRRAHELVRGNLAEPGTAPAGPDIAALIRRIVQPHDADEDEEAALVSLDGPPVPCGEHAATNIALVVHELATNAAKYGALTVDGGTIAVGWREEEGRLVMRWAESGGPAIDSAPAKPGFGTTLVENSVAQQLGGTVVYDWQPGGLVLTLIIPTDALAA